MDSVSKRLCALKQTIVEYRIMLAPILVAIALARREYSNQR
jgi:hypothetical protein